MARAQTLTIPNIAAVAAAGSTVGPALLARATSGPQRLLVRNVGPNVVLLGYTAQAVSDLSQVQDSYRLDPGFADVFVLEKTDSVYASALGNNGQISTAVSAAFPLDTFGGS